LARLPEAVNTEQAHPRLGGLATARHRMGLRVSEPPPDSAVPTGRLPLAAGRVIFIRRESPAGTVSVLSRSFRVGSGINLRRGDPLL
jgi:hypothetical protein